MHGVLTKTGQAMKFTDVAIGQPFFAHGVFWTRIGSSAASEIKGSDWVGARVCDFLCDSPYRQGEIVEYVTMEIVREHPSSSES